MPPNLAHSGQGDSPAQGPTHFQDPASPCALGLGACRLCPPKTQGASGQYTHPSPLGLAGHPFHMLA